MGKRTWSREETKQLVDYVEFEELSWKEIQEKMPHRPYGQLFSKYHYIKDKQYNATREERIDRFKGTTQRGREFKKDYDDGMKITDMIEKHNISDVKLFYEIVKRLKIKKRR